MPSHSDRVRPQPQAASDMVMHTSAHDTAGRRQREKDRRQSATGRVAVLIPVYRDEDGRLASTLASLAEQGIAATAVVVDDGSPTPVVVDEGRCPVPVVVLRQPKNEGIERALNAGLEYIVAQGFEYVARLDSGDRCRPGRLAAQARSLDANAQVALIGSAVQFVHTDGTPGWRFDPPTTHAEIARALHHTVCLLHPAVMFRTSIVQQVGPYSLDYPAAEDYEFFWRIARVAEVANLPEILLDELVDPRGISLRRRRRQLLTTMRIRFEFFRWTEPMSYVGLAKVLALLVTPTSLVHAAKRILWPRRGDDAR